MFTVERKGLERLGLPQSMTVFAEISEAVTAIIDPVVQSVLRKYENAVDYIHFSDQYSGLKPTELVIKQFILSFFPPVILNKFIIFCRS